MFEQIKLKYDFNSLEPYIDELTMVTHYTKHHAAYTNNFNAAVKTAGLENKAVEQILANLDEVKDESIKNTLRNNGGGYFNHNLYFLTLSNNGKKMPSEVLSRVINQTFGSFEEMKNQLATSASSRFGSGWAWLSTDNSGKLKVSSSPNQDNPIMESHGLWKPILAIDVWEHAYYLKYKNLRGDYIKALFNIINWQEVERLYTQTVK